MPASLFYRKYKMRNLIIIATLLNLTACLSGNTSPSKNDGPGSIITGRAEQVSAFQIDGQNTNDRGWLPINALLWRASLDIASTIPLDDVDTFGGTIVSDWYQVDRTSDERIKMTVFVLDRELRSDGIRVVVYIQKRVNDVWQDSGTDIEMGRQIEELILTRAREIRTIGVVETNN